MSIKSKISEVYNQILGGAWSYTNVIKNSGLFDVEYYLDQNPDVRASGMNPFKHYLKHGFKEGREPSAYFSVQRYKAENPDLTGKWINPVLRWIRHYLRDNRIFPISQEIIWQQILLREFCNPFENENNIALNDENFVVSIVTATYNTLPRYLDELYQTLANQTYTNWQWVIADDGSASLPTINTLRILAARDPRVVVVFRPRNSGISEATNAAINAATGTHIALVDHDDLLARDALESIWNSWRNAPDTDLFYTDECKLSDSGRIYDLALKPGYSPTLIENTMYTGHLSVYRRAFLDRIGLFRSQFDGTQDFDLALRAFAATDKIRHVDCIAYLWRAIPGSSALSLDAKSWGVRRQQGALEEYARAKHADAQVKPSFSGGYWRIEYPLPFPAPLVSCVIPTAGGRRTVRGAAIDLLLNCIDSFEKKAFFRNIEFVVVHNGDLSGEQKQFLAQRENVRLVEYTGKTLNLSQKINMGVEAARGDFVCLLNDDIEAITPGGGDDMVGYLAANPQLGAIAPLCLYENGTVQHNGVIMLTQGPSHYGIGKPPSFGGNGHVLRCRRDTLGVSGALLICRKEVYTAVGGFDERLPLNYNDVDFCLKLRAKGLGSVVDPAIQVHHYESASKIGTFKCEKETLFAWHGNIEDPYYNKRFVASNPFFQIAPNNEAPPDYRSANAFERWLDMRIHERIGSLSVQDGPFLSVIVPIFNQPRRFLNEMLQSYLMQTYTRKELVMVDDGSTDPETIAWLAEVERTQPVRILRHEKNMGINGANRTLLSAARGDFVLPIDADDFMTIDALQVMAHAIVNTPGAKVFYSDEFKSDMTSNKFSPFLKSDFDPVMLTNCCFPTHLMAMERAFMNEIGAYQADEATWCHDYDTTTLALANGVEAVHVPELLYAWRINPGSTASMASGQKPGTVASQRFVLERLLRSRGKAESVGITPNNVIPGAGMWQLEAKQPLASIATIDARSLWEKDGDGFIAAIRQALTSGRDWIAILMDTDNAEAQCRLSAPALFEPRVAAVSGYLSSQAGDTYVWTGGHFGPLGQVLDPGFGLPVSSGGYHGQLACQRCVDILAPTDLLVRADMAEAALARMMPGNEPEDFLIHLAIEIINHKLLCVVTPHVVHAMPREWRLPLPLDRSALIRAANLPETRWLHPLRQILLKE